MQSKLYKSSQNPWAVADFEKNRPQLTEFVKDEIIPYIDNPRYRRILIRGPVKSGKRDITEYIAKRDESTKPRRVHAYISSFVRKADSDQRDEMKKHNLAVFPILNRKNVEECIKWIKKQLEDGKEVVLHLDECDFGAGYRQLLSKIYREFRINTKVKMVLYSATPEEVLHSGEVDNEDEDEDEDEYEDEDEDELLEEFKTYGKVVIYNPPPEFCGPGKFLDAGLVKDATPFYRIKKDGKLELTEQGRDIVTRMLEEMKNGSKRNMLMLRLSASDIKGTGDSRKDNKDMYKFAKGWKDIPELRGFIVMADKDEDNKYLSDVMTSTIKYSDREYWKLLSSEHPVIITYDQTSSRSTEWKMHDRIFATHDYRNTITYSVVVQAQERTNHYIGPNSIYPEFQQIEIYGHKKTFELSAGRSSIKEYLKNDWHSKKIDKRVAKKKKLEGPHYQLYYKNRIPPEYPNPLPEDQCNKILQDKGCFADVNISPRVSSSIDDKPVYKVKFYKCTKDTFSNDDIKDKYPEFKELYPEHNFKNPFIKSEEEGLDDDKYQGFLRVWKVWDYKDIEENEPGFGAKKKPRLTICYKDGVLGVAVRYKTNEMEEVGTVETVKSMYKK
jgi:hypothetical protein